MNEEPMNEKAEQSDAVKCIAVTGASGFIGAALVRAALAAGFQVRATGRRADPPENWPHYTACDIADTAKMRHCFEGADAVIHAAGLAHQFGRARVAAAPFHEVNVEGTKCVVQAALASGAKRMILLSSVSVYGPHGRAVVDEDCPCRPLDPYAVSKREAELAAMEMTRDTPLQLLVLRPATVYGEDDPGNVARLMDAVDRKRFFWLGAGRNKKSMIHKDDVASACIAALLAPPSAEPLVFNVADQAYTMREIVDEIAAALNRRVPPVHVPASPALMTARGLSHLPKVGQRFGSIHDTMRKWLADDVYDGNRLAQYSGFRAKVDLKTGLQREAAWFRSAQQAKD